MEESSQCGRLRLIHYLNTIITAFFFLFNFAASAGLPPYSCARSSVSYPFCHRQLPIGRRVDDLISRLTLDEKISQLVDVTPAIPRLGIPRYDWWSEALHGVASDGKGMHFDIGPIKSATSFPQVIHSAASFSREIWFRIGQVASTEARAMYNSGQATGLTFWAPNINIFRDPRWGRGMETPGEDPLTVGEYAAAYVTGFQGNAPEYHLKASACCKHFTGYDLDKWGNVNRYSFNAKVTQQDLADTYQPPFQKCIQKGRASGIMCSYNSVNGVPTCTNYGLLTKTARADWGFNGYIVSDCNAVNVITSGHHYTNTPEDAVADVFKAGMDIECGSQTLSRAKSALAQGKLSVADINRALHNLFSIRMRLGLFDGNPFSLPYGNITAKNVCTQEHQSLALSAAQQGIVLLKNEKNHLPLSRTRTRTLAVIGPNANNPLSLLSNYHGPPCNLITPLRGLQSYIRDVRFVQGCDTTACSSPSIAQAVEIAKLADQVVLFMGLDTSLEQEMTDRVNLLLPGKQQALISSVAKAAKNPVTLVLINGGSLDVTFAKYEPKIGSILWAGYPGEAGGRALADVIFGVHNPGGRLPVTWYPQGFIKVPMTDMRMRPDGNSYPGRTYRFYKGPAVFPFAHGLSYTKYQYEFVSVSQTKITINQNRTISTGLYDTSLMGEQICDSLKFSAVVEARNDGKMTGTHPVLLFVRGSTARDDDAPIKELVGFKSVHLDSNEAAHLKFEVRPCEHLSRSLEDGSRVMEAGSHFLMVGDVETQVSVAGL